MTDRELIELAAKATGIKGWWETEYLSFIKCEGGPWDPLIDDGDAFKLIVVLKLTVVVESDMVFCRNQMTDEAFSEQGADTYAATRRAIVRAAAEIGKTKDGSYSSNGK